MTVPPMLAAPHLSHRRRHNTLGFYAVLLLSLLRIQPRPMLLLLGLEFVLLLPSVVPLARSVSSHVVDYLDVCLGDSLSLAGLFEPGLYPLPCHLIFSSITLPYYYYVPLWGFGFLHFFLLLV